MFVLIFIVVLVQYSHSELLETENFRIKPSSPGFLLTMPKVLFWNKNQQVCFSTHYTSFPVKLKLDFKIKKKYFTILKTVHSDEGCFEVKITDTSKEVLFVSVKVEATLNNNSTYNAHNQDPILIYPAQKLMFIETDRVMYKPEDMVKMKVLCLDEDLLSVPDYEIPYIRILNPLGIGVAVWENVSTQFGLAHLEHQLTQNALTGIWKIESETKIRTFEVTRYTLPRFKVWINHPKTVYYKAASISIKVCALYSFGGIVQGSAFIRINDMHQLIKNIEQLKKMNEGCAEFNFRLNDLLLIHDFPENHPIHVLFTATVTESGTDRIELTTSKGLIFPKPYNLKFSKKDMFKPGIPYTGILELKNVNTVVRGEIIEICYAIAIQKSWNYLKDEHCSNFTITEDNFIQFHILPLKKNVIQIQLNARSLKYSDINDNLLVTRMFSPSSSYLKIKIINPENEGKCRSGQVFSVEYTAEQLGESQNLTLYYMLKSHGTLKMRKIHQPVSKFHPDYAKLKNVIGLPQKYHNLNAEMGKLDLRFKLDKGITSNYRILVYYIAGGGEVVSTTEEVSVETCLRNKVKANWSHKQISTGGTASLLMETHSDSVCFVSAVDSSTTFNQDNTLNIKNVLKGYLNEKVTAESHRKSCVTPTKKHKIQSITTEVNKTGERVKRYVYAFSEDYDVYDVFNQFGVLTITNFKIVTKPCYIGPLPPSENAVQSLTDQYDASNEDHTTSIRSYFPETWLWEMIPIRDAAVIHRDLPDTITAWLTNVLCVSSIDGLGFSKPTEISTFQPFFIDIILPPSIKKGEVLSLQAVVFNYLTYNIPVKISIKVSKSLVLVDKLNRKSFSYCIATNNSLTHVFEMQALKAEKVNITVIAEVDPNYPGHCGPDIIVNRRDVIVKSVIVESEGFLLQKTKSSLLCTSDYNGTDHVSWNLKIPNDIIVPGTPYGEIILNEDILGQTIQNFDNLIEMPTGCGEQILSNLAPNLFIFQYLNATNKLSSSVKHRILRNMKIGYQRILNYAHKDGSFSAFGYHDPAGSMFLTAFVVRILQNLKHYIYVNNQVIERATSWIISHQLENGCFDTMLHVFQDMGGMSLENSTVGLTSFVMICLLDGDLNIPETVKTNAKYCIRDQYFLDKYTLAISSYALWKLKWYTESNRMLNKLLHISTHDGNMVWWTNKEVNGSLSSDIETTSYVLLTLLQQKNQQSLATAYSIIQWLTSHQGSRGGFKSTQDTVTALDALTSYLSFVHRKNTNLNVNITADHYSYLVEISNDDKLRAKRINLKNFEGNVKMNVNGNGCVLAQIYTKYFVKRPHHSDAFKLNTELLPVSNLRKCSVATLVSCFSYNGLDLHSNMAILEVELPSGFQADRVSLYSLINENLNSKVKMFEEKPDKIIFYLTHLSTEQICINFKLQENSLVRSRSNSTVKLYDYYKPEYYTVEYYNIVDSCK